MNINTPFLFDDKDSHSLERNHTHFLLLDDGKYQSLYLCNETNDETSSLTNQHSESDERIHEDQAGLMKVTL
jgi:hypothetical protein